MSRIRLTGALLFLFIPLVLVLYLRMPLGLPGSIVLGMVLMFAHRLVARPFMDRHLERRCFWCGSDLPGPGVPAPFLSRRQTIESRTCSGTHADRLIAFARMVAAGRLVVFLLIALPVSIYLGNALLMIAGHGFLPLDTARAAFSRLLVPRMLVSMKASGPLIERSTWLSAAK